MAAAQLTGLRDEATCSICLEYFTDPVSTDCGHVFCRSCITQSWEGRDGNSPCPQCREISPGRSLRPNRQLENMVEMVKQLHLPPVKPPEGNLCEKHEEKLRLFCEEDQTLICVVCDRSKEHRSHSVSPIEEAAQEYKVKLQDWLCPLRKEMGYILESKLREEEQCTTMRDVRSALDRCKKVKFQGPESEMKKTREEEVMITLKPEEEMKKYKVMVTLDPDTAHPQLLLSEGGRRVRGTDTAQPLPDTPKRFTSSPCVLGGAGFTSGRHYWEVQLLQEGVGWTVGVAAESVERKGGVTWSPEGGVWAVEGWRGRYRALTSPPTPLSPRERPLKLGVYLDYEGGRLSLYNADSMELLYTFPRTRFTRRIFPIFSLWWGAELRMV
ncbi:E3 ubiquitin-protein ligase TRIM39-like isoform X2 [Pleurodeles waltl]|uniref:E3 ubiquitin-protein ligase TRIM39-like isoform X2 n=1 Tax=Pleurodeles waltl TaxID=8319 RepID=UPI0037095B78